MSRHPGSETTGGEPVTSGYVPNIHHPDVMRSMLEQIVDTGDVIGPAGPGQTILAVTVAGPTAIRAIPVRVTKPVSTERIK